MSNVNVLKKKKKSQLFPQSPFAAFYVFRIRKNNNNNKKELLGKLKVQFKMALLRFSNYHLF